MEILYCSLGFHASIGTCQSCSKELTTYHNHCICKNNHKTCNDCYMDVVIEAALDGGNQKEILCTTGGDILAPIKPKVSGEHVFIYVDDSNM